jgi:hypothetical protein
LAARFIRICSICPSSHRTDVFAQQAAQQRLSLRDHAVELEHLRVLVALARERRELPGDRRARRRGRANLPQVRPRRARFRHRVERDRGAAGDPHQQVVEVVRDAARERADGLELLRVVKLRLELAVLGDVLGDPGNAANVAVVVLDGIRAVPDPPHRLVRPDDAVLLVERIAVQQVDVALLHARPIVRVDHLLPRARRVRHFAHGPSPDPLERRARVHEALRVGVRRVEHVLDALRDLAHASLANGDSGLRAPARGDVEDDADRVDRNAPLPDDPRRRLVSPHDLTGPRHEPLLGIDGGVRAGARGAQHAERGIAVERMRELQNRSALQLGCVVPEPPAERRVGVEQLAARRDHDDTAAGLLEYVAQALLAFGEHGLRRADLRQIDQGRARDRLAVGLR